MSEQEQEFDKTVKTESLDDKLSRLKEVAERVEDKVESIEEASIVTQETLQLEFQV